MLLVVAGGPESVFRLERSFGCDTHEVVVPIKDAEAPIQFLQHIRLGGGQTLQPRLRSIARRHVEELTKWPGHDVTVNVYNQTSTLLGNLVPRV